MSYIVEQKIKGNIYLYKVDSYWDKKKKQSRQKRTYIGPKKSKRKIDTTSIDTNFVYKNYGNIYLLDHISNKIGLTEIIKDCFQEDFKELLALAFYEISEINPLYLFPYWLQENHIENVKKLDSSAISKLSNQIGRDQKSRLNFQEQWISNLKPVDALYYDITSISSYSSNIDFVEWGYNRDHEKLAQINMGVVFCNKSSLPVYYTLYPGSIVDVKTLCNCVKFLKSLGLKDFMFILDRGFFSVANIATITKSLPNIKFIQPLPFSLKKAKQLIKEHKKDLNNIKSNFTFNQELLSHVKSEIKLGDKTYPANIYLNEKAELEQRQQFMRKLIEIENKIIKNRRFENQKEAQVFKENNIEKTYQDYFKYTRKTKMLERNTKTINSKLSKFGFFILAVNDDTLSKEDILMKYRDKDQVEKVFDLLKNEMDGARLRAHNQLNADARIFIRFIALIIQSEIIKAMRKAGLFKKYTVREVLAELKKIKYSKINDEIIISEISKKCRNILEAFDITPEQIHSY